MKKFCISFFMAGLLIGALLVTAVAVPSRIAARPALVIKNEIAYCSGSYDNGNSNDNISLTLTLKQGTTIIDSWNADGSCRVRISETCPVKSGKPYTLVLVVKVNGKEVSNTSVSGNS